MLRQLKRRASKARPAFGGLLLVGAAATKRLYVARDGDDAGAGTKEDPFAENDDALTIPGSVAFGHAERIEPVGNNAGLTTQWRDRLQPSTAATAGQGGR